MTNLVRPTCTCAHTGNLILTKGCTWNVHCAGYILDIHIRNSFVQCMPSTGHIHIDLYSKYALSS